MITNSGKERIAALIDTDLDEGKLGTSTQAPALTDTDLILEATSTIELVDATRTGRQLIVDYEIDSVTGNGSTYSEYGNFMTDGSLLNRTTFTGVPKNSSIEFQVKTIVNIV